MEDIKIGNHFILREFQIEGDKLSFIPEILEEGQKFIEERTKADPNFSIDDYFDGMIKEAVTDFLKNYENK